MSGIPVHLISYYNRGISSRRGAYIFPSIPPFQGVEERKNRAQSSFLTYPYRRRQSLGTNEGESQAGVVIRVPIVNSRSRGRWGRSWQEGVKKDSSKEPVHLYPGMRSGIMTEERKERGGGGEEGKAGGKGVKKRRSGEERGAEKRRNLRFNKGCLKAR